jgi:hypothetical protein
MKTKACVFQVEEREEDLVLSMPEDLDWRLTSSRAVSERQAV